MTQRIKKQLIKTKNHPLAVKIAIFTVFFIIIKLATGIGGEHAAENIFRSITDDPSSVTGILSLELNYPPSKSSTMDILASQSPILASIASINLTSEPVKEPHPSENIDPDELLPSQEPDEIPPQADNTAFYNYALDAGGIRLKNKTDYSIDKQAMLNEDLNIHINPTSPQVLIIHTHGSEAYYPDGDDIYTASDPSRTEDKRYNLVRIGDRLTELLEARGISVIHDRELYDYPTYTGSYNRSLSSIETYLKKYPDIKVVLDMHRDALEESDGTIHRTSADIGGVTCSQILLIAGSNYSGLDHPNWRENLKFALHLQADMDEKYPGLTRPIKLSPYRYNQHATTGSLIVEVGCTGNTLQESLLAAEHFADCLGDVLMRFADEDLSVGEFGDSPQPNAN